MSIKNISDISNIISDPYLSIFWNKLSIESKECILSQYLKAQSNFSQEKALTLCDNKLVVEKGTGIHKIKSNRLDALFDSRVLTSQVFIDGKLCNYPMEGNIAPFCTHFVLSPFDFMVSDLNLSFKKIEETHARPQNWSLFYYDLKRFNSMQEFMNSNKYGFNNSFPVLFIYRRIANDIDIMNDINLSIHRDFKENSYIVDSDEDGYPEFEYFIDRTMAILGGVNINNLDGIIVCKGFWDKAGKTYQYNFDEFIYYLSNYFPNLYISDEFGEIIYKPDNTKIKILNRIENPFIISYK